MYFPRFPLAFLATLILFSGPADAQRRRNQAVEPWPPEKAYSRLFLGGALQDVFELHYDFCGFTRQEGQRDYTPPTLERFLGKRSLRTRVEKANINGGNLLSYVFTAAEVAAPLDRIHYRPERLLYNPTDGIDLLPLPRDGFDSFILTENCGGYLKASLDAGWKPPYAAFAAALDTDARRSSSVLAMAGSFESPLSEILAANDHRTAELMSQLWQFYQANPQYGGEAYYLRQFDGIVIKHLADSKEVVAAEQSVGLNVALPFSAKLNAELMHGSNRENTFSGSDWETIVYTDFDGPYSRASLYQALPTPSEVADYFHRLVPITVAPAVLREGAVHEISVSVAGLPAELAGAGWGVRSITEGVYVGNPTLEVGPTKEGLSFTLSGRPADAVFHTRQVEPVPASFTLVLPGRNGVPDLLIPVTKTIATSAHPLVDLASTRFELHRRNSGQYAFQWHLTVNVEDGENPLASRGQFETTNLLVGGAEDTLHARVVATTYDARRAVLSVTLESDRSWPLKMIDDRTMRTFPVRAELSLPVGDGFGVCHRPLTASLAVPRIVAPATAPLPVSPPFPGPGPG
ncbi:hypothetical protein [Neolewinella litorea]|uniref:Uncharacterized protein n=1 Tax=Neolewinella litorea TaxID=2562452 RepID=A0A4S4NSX1_9BACT|nr:hypothetical protein [Neolewinella litorea]THH41548.1 hypothetical protein E4021_02845 [Neolewinella litorea]